MVSAGSVGAGIDLASSGTQCKPGRTSRRPAASSLRPRAIGTAMAGVTRDWINSHRARVAESVDAGDSKSPGHWPYEFESRPGYSQLQT